jgi:Flp pilus assembly pilin Flp
MLAVILMLVIGTIRLIGGNANNVFSSVGSTITTQ